jgi:hypothetical protein
LGSSSEVLRHRANRMSTQIDTDMRRIALAAHPASDPAAATRSGSDLRRVGETIPRGRLIAYSLGVLVLVATSLGTMASQSDKFVGVHEVPPFICDRVELVPGLAANRAGGDARPDRHEPVAPGDVAVPGSRNPICTRSAAG